MNSVGTISIRSIRALKSGDTIRDTTLKGFGARYRNKYITYFVHTRINGRLAWIKIGYHGSPWTPEEARKRAAELLRDMGRGVDPRIPKLDSNNALTFSDLFQRFISVKENYLKPGTVLNYRILAARHIVPYFKNRPVNTLTRADVTGLHLSMKGTPGAANHTVVLLKAVINWAEVEGLRGDRQNPCLRFKPFPAKRRARFLSVEDLQRLGEAIQFALVHDQASPVQIAAILLLLFTGARRSEIFTLKRSYVDRSRMIAHLPDSKTGARVLQLNAHALAVLDSIPAVDGNPYYLVGRKDGRCISEIKKPWDKIRKRAKLEGFRLHDFRHSFASFAADSGATAEAVGAILGHASIETTKIYTHLFDSRAREVSAATANAMHSIINNVPRSKDFAEANK